MLKKSNSRGFTLIELMIVVAIIGILAAVAIPQYQTYVARSQVTRVMSESGMLKTLTEVCVNEGRLVVGAGLGQCNPGAVGSTLIDGLSQTGAVLPTGTGVAQVTIQPDGQIVIESTFSGSSAVPLIGQTLRWSRSAQGSWHCNTTVDIIFRPRDCEASI